MADLKCMAENCIYNEQHYCSKADIMVGGKEARNSGETCCESFLQRTGGERAMKNTVSQASKMTGIDCEAQKCCYNQECKCTAKHVDISGCNAHECQGTACMTFCECR